jgi:hypothetical protein
VKSIGIKINLLLLVLSIVFCMGCQNIIKPTTISETTLHQTNHVGTYKEPSEFVGYDEKITSLIEDKWYNLLASRRSGKNKVGKVVVKFKLYPDGSISDVNISEQFDYLLSFICLEAINESAPFPKWPNDINNSKQDYREISFTFYYGTNQIYRLNR